MRRPSHSPWLVAHDPQRLYTGPFNRLDIEETARAGYWPEGIVFINKRTGKQLIYQHGQLDKHEVRPHGTRQ